MEMESERKQCGRCGGCDVPTVFGLPSISVSFPGDILVAKTKSNINRYTLMWRTFHSVKS